MDTPLVLTGAKILGLKNRHMNFYSAPKFVFLKFYEISYILIFVYPPNMVKGMISKKFQKKFFQNFQKTDLWSPVKNPCDLLALIFWLTPILTRRVSNKIKLTFSPSFFFLLTLDLKLFSKLITD